MSNQLNINSGVLSFNETMFEFISIPKPWYKSNWFTILFCLIVYPLLINSALKKNDNVLLVLSSVALLLFIILGILELITLTTKKKKDLILIADISRVKLTKMLFNYVSVKIYHGKMGFREFRCHKKKLRDVGFIPFIQQLNIPVSGV